MTRIATQATSVLIAVGITAVGVGAVGVGPSLAQQGEEAATSVDQILEDLQVRMADVQSVYLEFSQEQYFSLFVEPVRSGGVMLIAEPDQIRWQTTEPYGSILLGGGDAVAQFEQKGDDWIKLQIGFPQVLQRVMEQMANMHQGRVDALSRDYMITAAVGAAAVVTLTPRDATSRALLSSIEVHMLLDYSATTKVVLNAPSGDRTELVFSNEERNVTYPAGTFDQAHPLPLDAVQAAVRNRG